MTDITSHILDTSGGAPAAGVTVTLMVNGKDGWRALASDTTNEDGRISAFDATELAPSNHTFRLSFDTGTWFEQQGLPVFFPLVDITFNIDPAQPHYHVPLLLNPFGYSTYRGS